jgi:Ala-tRNA(Pro) deacylase
MTGRLREFLTEKRARYEVRAHDQAFTAQKVAAASHVPGREMAKVVVVRDGDGRPYMAVLPAPKQLDLDALCWAAGVKTLRLASETEFRALFPDCEVGAMPPFGHLYGMNVYLDDGFAPRRPIYFEDGTHRQVVGMRYEEFVRLERPLVTHVARGVNAA